MRQSVIAGCFQSFVTQILGAYCVQSSKDSQESGDIENTNITRLYRNKLLKVKRLILTLVRLGHHLKQQGKIWRNEDQKIEQSQRKLYTLMKRHFI